jgi:predicted ATPase
MSTAIGELRALSDCLELLRLAESPAQVREAFGHVDAALNAMDDSGRKAHGTEVQEALKRAGFEWVRGGTRPTVVLVPSLGEMWLAGEIAAALGRSRLLFRLLDFIVNEGPEADRNALFGAVWDQLYLGESSDNSLYVALNRLRRKFVRKDLPIEPTHQGAFALECRPAAYRWSPVTSAPEASPQPNAASNLVPLHDASFGREEMVNEIVAALSATDTLLTIVGTGGAGKTRLSRMVGLHLVGQAKPPPGIWFVDLSEAMDADGLIQAIAQVLGVPLKGCDTEESALNRLGAAIRTRRDCWLLLDNFEQIVDVAAHAVAALHRDAPEARFLITSREALGLEGEQVIALDTLDTAHAIRLFEDRAHYAKPGLVWNVDDRQMIERIVEELDNLPLAIELAAARLRMFTLEQIFDRLSDALRLLAERHSERPTRHQTLRATIDWSWQLLAPWEKDALAQCAVFRGGFSANAAESVVDLSAHPDAPWLFDVLEDLVDQSLLAWGSPNGLPNEPRLRMLRTVWQFAHAKLERSDSNEATQQRLATWAVHHGRTLLAEFMTAEDARPRLRLYAERDNLQAAFENAKDRDWSTALDVLLVLGHVLRRLGHLNKLLQWLDEAEPHLTGEPLIRLLISRGRTLTMVGRAGEARVNCEAAWALCNEVGATNLAPTACRWMGEAAYELGEIDPAQAHLEMARQLYRKMGDASGEGRTLTVTGTILRFKGEMTAATAALSESVALLRSANDREYEAVALAGLGAAARVQGHIDDALHCYNQALAINNSLQFRSGTAYVQENLANLLAGLGRHDEARTHYADALQSVRERGTEAHEAALQTNLGNLLVDCGEMVEAEQCYRAALIAHQRHGRTVYEAYTTGCLGSIMLERGQVAEAAEQLNRGIDLLEKADVRRHAAFFRAILSTIHADAGDVDLARTELDQARSTLNPANDPTGLALCDVLEGHLDLGVARKAPPGKKRQAHIEQAQRRIADARKSPADSGNGSNRAHAPAELSLEIRAAIRRLERKMAAVVESAE